MRNKEIAIFGTSGFSRETLDVCMDNGYEEIVFIGEGRQDEGCWDYRVVDESQIVLLQQRGFVFIIGIGENLIRRKIFQRYPDLHYVNVVHSSATFGDNQLKNLKRNMGNIITAGVRMTNNIRMGNFGIFNLNCTIGHDCIIEDFVNVAPGANISGNVRLSEGAYIGTNAAILQGKSIDKKIVIGRYATVGAGAVVTRSVPDDAIVKGAPARQDESTIKGNVQDINGTIREKNNNHRGGGTSARGHFHPESLGGGDYRSFAP